MTNLNSTSLDGLMPSDEDLIYEEEVLRNPYSLKVWWRYLSERREIPAKRRYDFHFRP